MPVLMRLIRNLAQTKSDELLRFDRSSDRERLIREGFPAGSIREPGYRVLYVGLELVAAPRRLPFSSNQAGVR